MNKGMREALKIILSILILLFMFWIGYSYRGPNREDNSSIALRDIISTLIPIVFLWLCYKVYELNKRVGSIESKLEDKKKDIV